MIGDLPAEEDPLRTAALLRAIGEVSEDLILAKDREGRLIYANAAYGRLVGRPVSEILGLTTLDVAPNPEDAHKIMASDQRIMASGIAEVLEEPFMRRDGIARIYRSSRTPMRDPDGKVFGIAVVATDITERKRGEEALRANAAQLSQIADALPVLMAYVGSDLIYRFANKGYEEWFGVPAAELRGKPIREVLGERVFQALQPTVEAVLRGERQSVDAFAPYPNGGRHVHLEYVPNFGPDDSVVGYFVMVHDIGERIAAERALRDLNETLEQRVAQAIAEREMAEEALRQAQKMEAVGQLTGGIAHDFNNLLTVVLGNIDMARRAQEAAGGDGRTRRALENAQKGAERAAALTQRLLAFSRRQPLEPKPLDINKLVLGMSDLLGRALGEMIKIEIVTSPDIWRVEVDPNQLESAILNLAVNARDAMPAGGRLMIETLNVRLDEDYAAANAGLAAGLYVLIAVTDNGTGMPREVVARVFEPFFTTKDVGRGTGLGLSQVYGFVRQSGGHVAIESEEGEGTTVRLYLPRRLVGDAPEEEAAADAVGTGTREETILVVEDDDDVRAFTVEILRAAGYRVLEAHDGPSALRLLERQAEPIDLLFTDVVMPGMSGRDLADVARIRQPDVKVLFTSGYTRDAALHGGRPESGIDIIGKPFTYDSLARKVRDMLDKNGQQGPQGSGQGG